MIRIAVTGTNGQVATALRERAKRRAEIVALGRPELELTDRQKVLATLRKSRCDAIINAAAYTAVDKAESEPEVAMAVNCSGAGYVAMAAAELGVPLVHFSTDYVFNGECQRPYREDDSTTPLGAYGRSKLEGEKVVASVHANTVILRTSWVYGPFGANFLRTMLRLSESRNGISVVADQRGNPTSSLDLADATLAMVERLTYDSALALRGLFNVTGAGEASWAEFAEEIFARAARHGWAEVTVRRITTADYPTLAKRPASSRLDNTKLLNAYGIALPEWRASVAACVDRLLAGRRS
jgi:dTDP-4-dehydrorhamnose reductase